MPNRHAVRAYWAARLSRGLYRKFSSEAVALSRFVCFACSSDWGRLDRAHIHPLGLEGSNDAANLHLLCAICHVESEDLTGRAYWRWFFDRHVADIYSALEGRRVMDGARPREDAQMVRDLRRQRRNTSPVVEYAA